jgi:hypothetical protein
VVGRRLSVAATLSLLVVPVAAAAEGPLPGGRAIVATASVSPSTHLFGDNIVARLDVVVDPREFDPDRLDVRLRFAPYEAVGGIGEERREVGPLLHLRYEATLRCLHADCLAPRLQSTLGGQEEGRGERHTIRLPPAVISYGGAVLLTRRFPAAQVVSRINTAQASALAPDARPGSQGAFAASVEPPDPTYRIRPRVLAGAALALACLLTLFPLALAWRLVHARWRAARRWRPLSPLERALALVDWTARRDDGDEDRRKALEALAVVLEQRGARPLAETARALAWDEEPPLGERAGQLGADARRELDGGARGRSA